MRGETCLCEGRFTQVALFNPLAPCGARRRFDRPRRRLFHFQSTRPLRGETSRICRMRRTSRGFSIHSPLAGRDARIAVSRAVLDFFNPLAPCGARPVASCAVPVHTPFSIHSPLAGRDLALSASPRPQCFSIHSPLAGRDALCWIIRTFVIGFQSTRPLRGETRGFDS